MGFVVFPNSFFLFSIGDFFLFLQRITFRFELLTDDDDDAAEADMPA